MEIDQLCDTIQVQEDAELRWNIEEAELDFVDTRSFMRFDGATSLTRQFGVRTNRDFMTMNNKQFRLNIFT